MTGGAWIGRLAQINNTAMNEAQTQALLGRIAQALERLAPAPATPPDFAGARLWRYDAAHSRFAPAPDYGLPLGLLVGVDAQKARFVENLRRFAGGAPSNHVLLWGARGTGKSSLAKAAFMDEAARTSSLRMLEIDRDDLATLPGLFATLRERTERMVILCDDLSFEDGHHGLISAAKSLKSAMEGGVLGPPGNVLFVATSNRRHLMPREHGEEARGLIAAAEDAEEEVSVSDRFGLWIGFPAMDQATYLAAVRGYAEQFGLPKKDLDRRALQWSLARGARSGRVAWQFTRDLAGEAGKPLPL
jgi:predicted AAA+ superfamily ATPase